MDINEKFQSRLENLEAQLINAGYFIALRALRFARPYHPGLRKDGITPAFMHQLEVCFTLLNDSTDFLNVGLDPDKMIAGGALHDTREENQDLPIETIEENFGPVVAEICLRLDKNYVFYVPGNSTAVRLVDEILPPQARKELIRNGWTPETINSLRQYLIQVADDWYSFIIKLHDRSNNIDTVRYLDPRAQPEYILETRKLSALAKIFVEAYSELASIIQKPRRMMKSSVETLLSDYELFANDLHRANIDLNVMGRSGEIIHALQAAGHIVVPSAPRPVIKRGLPPQTKVP